MIDFISSKRGQNGYYQTGEPVLAGDIVTWTGGESRVLCIRAGELCLERDSGVGHNGPFAPFCVWDTEEGLFRHEIYDWVPDLLERCGEERCWWRSASAVHLKKQARTSYQLDLFE